MYIQIPAQIAVDSLLQDVDHVGAHHGYVVFETILADILHQFLEVVHLRHGDTSVHAIRVVGQLALAQIALDASQRVVSRNAEEGEITLRTLGIHSSEGIDLTERTSQHAERAKLQVTHGEALREIATVCADALVAVFGKVVVPVAQGSRTSRSQAQGIHGHSTGHVSLTGTRDELLAQHTHGHTGSTAVVLLQRVPALDGSGVHFVGLNPLFHSQSELGLQGKLLLISLGHFGVVADFFHLSLQRGSLIVDLTGIEDDFAHVHGHDGDAASLKEFLAVAASVESQRTSADLADTCMSQLTYDATNGSKLMNILHQQVAVDGIRVQGGVSERYAVLVKIVAHRNLSAESIAATVEVDLVVLVVTSLNQHRHIQLCAADGIDNADFKAEVGQRHDDTIDFITMSTEQGSAFLPSSTVSIEPPVGVSHSSRMT